MIGCSHFNMFLFSFWLQLHQSLSGWYREGQVLVSIDWLCFIFCSFFVLLGALYWILSCNVGTINWENKVFLKTSFVIILCWQYKSAGFQPISCSWYFYIIGYPLSFIPVLILLNYFYSFYFMVRFFARPKKCPGRPMWLTLLGMNVGEPTCLECLGLS